MKKKLLISILMISLLIISALPACTAENGDGNITRQCKITVSHGSIRKLTDGDLKEYWEAKKSNSTVSIVLPEGVQPGGILIEWFAKPEKFEVKQYDASNDLISQQTDGDFFKAYITWIDLKSETAKIDLTVYKSGRISGLHIYSDSDNPEIQKWQKPAEKSDILLVVAHQDDEELWFGGLLPYYGCVRSCNVQTLYMTCCGRTRVKEALNGLWVMGIQTVPEILEFKDSYTNVKDAEKRWGGKKNVESKIVEMIRKYRPEVIVTHDLKGEYGHPQHKLIAMRMEGAVKAAADPKQFSESAALYGAWEVKKIYLHLSDTRTIYMDWETPAEVFGGKTPLEMAELGFLQHVSQLKRYSMDMGKKYDYTKFGLIYTTVGDDILKNDFLENTSSAQKGLIPEG